MTVLSKSGERFNGIPIVEMDTRLIMPPEHVVTIGHVTIITQIVRELCVTPL